MPPESSPTRRRSTRPMSRRPSRLSRSSPARARVRARGTPAVTRSTLLELRAHAHRGVEVRGGVLEDGAERAARGRRATRASSACARSTPSMRTLPPVTPLPCGQDAQEGTAGQGLAAAGLPTTPTASPGRTARSTPCTSSSRLQRRDAEPADRGDRRRDEEASSKDGAPLTPGAGRRPAGPRCPRVHEAVTCATACLRGARACAARRRVDAEGVAGRIGEQVQGADGDA